MTNGKMIGWGAARGAQSRGGEVLASRRSSGPMPRIGASSGRPGGRLSPMDWQQGLVAATVISLVAVILAPTTAVGRVPPAEIAGCSHPIFDESFAAALEEDYPGSRFTAQVVDLGSGCRYRLNPDTVITTASVRKVAFLAAALRNAAAEDRWLTDWEQDRARPMIIHSANAEASELRAHLGGRAAMAGFDEDFGMRDTIATDPWGATPTSARDQIRLLRRTLLNETRLLEEDAVDYMWKLMGSVTGSQTWGVSRGAPLGWDVAQKNGFYPASGPWRVNSVGVVAGPEGQGYTIAILTDGWPDLPDGIAAVERIAEHVADGLAPPPPDCSEPTMQGTPGDDILIGTSGPDVIAGGRGNDLIRGRGGADVLCGGPGDDVIHGNAGRDTVRGGRGSDTLAGGRARDLLIGGPGVDELAGRGGRDIARGGADADLVAGGRHDDRLQGGGAGDRLDGGLGDDLLIGGGGDDTCLDPGVYESWLVWSGCEHSAGRRPWRTPRNAGQLS